MFCRYCGNEVVENTKICTKCGKPIFNEAVPNKVHTFEPNEIIRSKNKKAKNMVLIVFGYVIITCLVLIGKKLEQYNVFWNKIFEYYRELNSIFILIPSISLFYIFKEIDIGCNKIINYFASISLGVYLFHESNFMRYRLWHEIITMEKIQRLHGGVITGLVISIIAFYAITAIIEFFRINLIEKNILKSKIINKLFKKIDNFMSIHA